MRYTYLNFNLLHLANKQTWSMFFYFLIIYHLPFIFFRLLLKLFVWYTSLRPVYFFLILTLRYIEKLLLLHHGRITLCYETHTVAFRMSEVIFCFSWAGIFLNSSTISRTDDIWIEISYWIISIFWPKFNKEISNFLEMDFNHAAI
jgi:hypothetical protein